jgi:hypothetical protein
VLFVTSFASLQLQYQEELAFCPSVSSQMHHFGIEDVFSFSGHFVQVVARTPQATGTLHAVCPDEAELLAAVALRNTVLSFIRLLPLPV